MIADGKIKIKQGVEIKKLTKDGVLFEDGVELKADIVVFGSSSAASFVASHSPRLAHSYGIQLDARDGPPSHLGEGRQRTRSLLGTGRAGRDPGRMEALGRRPLLAHGESRSFGGGELETRAHQMLPYSAATCSRRAAFRSTSHSRFRCALSIPARHRHGPPPYTLYSQMQELGLVKGLQNEFPKYKELADPRF